MTHIKFKITILVLLFGVGTAKSAISQDAFNSLQSINQSQYHELKSEVLGRSLHIVVKPPAGYSENPRKKFPVIYLLDGGAIFPALTGYSNYLLNQGDIPEVLIVGISYAAIDFEHGNFRSTDYTVPTDQREWWGGAEVFQGVIENELIPLIESNYRADPDKRVIFGQSIAGKFVLYTALTRPDLFWGHIASNPALHRNLEFFQQRHFDDQASKSKLFVASASDDEPRFREPAVAWIDHWNQEENLPWELNAITIEGYGHFSLLTESFRQGVIWVFD